MKAIQVSNGHIIWTRKLSAEEIENVYATFDLADYSTITINELFDGRLTGRQIFIGNRLLNNSVIYVSLVDYDF